MPCISQQFAPLTSSSSHLRPFLGNTISLASSSIWLHTPWHDRILAQGQTALRSRWLARTLSNTNCAVRPIGHLQAASSARQLVGCFRRNTGRADTNGRQTTRNALTHTRPETRTHSVWDWLDRTTPPPSFPIEYGQGKKNLHAVLSLRQYKGLQGWQYGNLC